MSQNMKIVVATVVTAIIVGGGVYMWQQRERVDSVAYTQYTNDVLGYSLRVPHDYVVMDHSLWNGSTLLHQIEFQKDSQPQVMVRVREEQELQLYFDEPPTGKTALGGQEANLYISKTGYGDAGGLSTPYTAVQTYKDGKMYVIEFYTTEQLNDEYQNILDSFKFID